MRKPPRPSQAMVPVELAPDPPPDLRERVVLITGGASNIGRGAALAFARAGAHVVIADLDPLAARETVADMQHLSPRSSWVRVNLLEDGEIPYLFERIDERYGRLDVLINNFGIGAVSAPPHETSAEQFDEPVRGNVRQQFLCTREALARMIEQGEGGSIIGTASIHGVVTCHDAPLYDIAKAGVHNLMRHVAKYYGRYGIRANTVCPGHILTERHYERYTDHDAAAPYPIGRIGTIRDVVQAYLYLASERAAFVSGALLMVDGGLTIH